MLKITYVSRFGDEDEYLDINFKNKFDDEIGVGIDYKRNVIRLSCDVVDIDDIKAVLAIIESKKIEITI